MNVKMRWSCITEQHRSIYILHRHVHSIMFPRSILPLYFHELIARLSEQAGCNYALCWYQLVAVNVNSGVELLAAAD